MNKLTKLLSVFVIAGAIGTGVAGAVGCQTNNSGHKHSYEYQQIPGNAEQHTVHCKNDGHTGGDTTEDHKWKDGKCEKCEYVQLGEVEGLVIPANVTGILIEGVTAETITLSTEKTSHTIDKSAIHVYFATGANADQKGDEVPAANLVLELKDGKGATVTSWENIEKGDTYKVNASIKDATMASGATATVGDLKKTVTVTISNPVVAGSLVVKAGATLEQAQSPTDSMTSTWTFEVTLANGKKQDVPASEVTVTGVDTTVAAESATATLTWGTVTGTVTYKITANENEHIVSTGYVFGASDAADSIAVNTEFKQGENTMLTLASGNAAKVTAVNKAEEGTYTEGGVTRRFYYRLQFGGGTWKANKDVNGDKAGRLEFTTTGAGVITLYYATNGSKDSVLNPEDGTVAEGDTKYGRGIGVYSGSIGKSDATTCLGREVVEDKLVHKFKVNIPEAGTYWIATANEKDIYFFGYQLDTVVNEAGDNVGLPTATETSEIKLTVANKEEDGTTSKVLKVGGKFESWVTAIKTVAWNPVSAVISEEAADDISTATYTIKTSSMAEAVAVTADSDITEAMLGNATITVTFAGKTATYTATVESLVPGVTGISASVKSTVETEVATAEAKATLNRTDIEAAIVGENANATVTITSVKYKAKDADDSTLAEITESVELGVGDYVIVVTATVEDATADKSASFETTTELKITKQLGDDEAHPVTLNVNDLTAGNKYTADEVLKDEQLAKITALVDCNVEANTGTPGYTNRLKTNGSMATNKKAIKVELKGKATIKIIYKKGGSSRTAGLYGSDGTVLQQHSDAADSSSDLFEYTFTAVEAGTYYLGGTNGINFYEIIITPAE